METENKSKNKSVWVGSLPIASVAFRFLHTFLSNEIIPDTSAFATAFVKQSVYVFQFSKRFVMFW